MTTVDERTEGAGLFVLGALVPCVGWTDSQSPWLGGYNRACFERVTVEGQDLKTGCRLHTSGEVHEPDDPAMRLPTDDGQLTKILVESHQHSPVG